jgi:PAS domain S-box-containing protein
MLLVRLRAPWFSSTRFRSSIVLRLLATVLVFSSIVTFALTALQLSLEYERGVGIIDGRLEDIRKSYLASLGEGLWRLDEHQLQLQLDGILRLSDIRFAEVREISSGAPMVVAAGHRASRGAISREFPILYRVGGVERQIGVLYVEATLAELYRELMNTALVILASQGAKTFLVSFFSIFAFWKLLTRHLTSFADFVGGYDFRRPPPPFHLDRPPRQEPDELDKVVVAFNEMSLSLQAAYDDVRQREARIRRLVESNIIGIFFWRLDGAITQANDALLETVGYSREELLSGRVSWADMTPPEHAPADERAKAEIAATGSCRPYEKEFVHKDGRRVPVLVGGALLEGSRDEGVAFVLDLTARRRAEQRQKLLLHELNHRVKNTLATVQAVAAQTLRTAESPDAFCRAFESRLLALSQTHNLLNRCNWEGVYLRDILELELAPYQGPGGRSFALAGDGVRLGPVTTVTLGMALHELVTNAAKYGALSVPTGKVHVTWQIDSRDRLRLEWHEQGGPPVQAPRRRGFGSRLIEKGLARELAGQVRLDFLRSGLRCTMDMSLERASLH